MLRRLRDRCALLIAPALVLSACVHQGPPRVTLDKRQTSLVFGVKAPAKPAGKAAPPVPVVEEEAPQEVQPPDPLPEFKKPDVAPPPPKPEICPEAEDAASAEKALSNLGDTLPEPGAFKYQEGGFVKFDAGGQEFITPIRARVTRAVANVEVTDKANNNFTFDYYRPKLTGERLLDKLHIQVRNDAVQKSPTQGVGIVTTPRFGEPERGIVVKSIESIDPRTGNTASGSQPFQPATGLLLLPLPVTPGETFQSVAVDRVRGRTIVLDGKVGDRQRVDACGDYVDGWKVEATVRDSAFNSDSPEESSEEYKHTYFISPQYGGLLIFEQYDFGEDPANPRARLTFTLNTLHPSPLPPGL